MRFERLKFFFDEESLMLNTTDCIQLDFHPETREPIICIVKPDRVIRSNSCKTWVENSTTPFYNSYTGEIKSDIDD
mgnify:CR=1 FL=1